MFNKWARTIGFEPIPPISITGILPLNYVLVLKNKAWDYRFIWASFPRIITKACEPQCSQLSTPSFCPVGVLTRCQYSIKNWNTLWLFSTLDLACIAARLSALCTRKVYPSPLIRRSPKHAPKPVWKNVHHLKKSCELFQPIFFNGFRQLLHHNARDLSLCF